MRTSTVLNKGRGGQIQFRIVPTSEDAFLPALRMVKKKMKPYITLYKINGNDVVKRNFTIPIKQNTKMSQPSIQIVQDIVGRHTLAAISQTFNKTE